MWVQTTLHLSIWKMALSLSCATEIEDEKAHSSRTWPTSEVSSRRVKIGRGAKFKRSSGGKWRGHIGQFHGHRKNCSWIEDF